MRSPFAIFRKHQKIAMVIVLVLIMVAFVLGDAVEKWSRGEMPSTLVIGMVAALFALFSTFVGVQTGKPIEYAIAGALIGVVVGFVVLNVGGTVPPVQTTLGDFGERKIQNLVQRRVTANHFIRVAMDTGIGEIRTMIPPRQWEQIVRRNLIAHSRRRITNSGSLEEDERLTRQRDVVIGFLLEHEADQMGIEISDEDISKYIKQISSEKLEESQLKQIIRQLQLSSERQLYDILKSELRASRALALLTPRHFASPQEYWNIHRKMKYTERLDVAAVPSEEFIGEIGPPETDELMAFFNEYRASDSNRRGPGTPGFLQPRKFRIAYIEADSEAMGKLVEPVTDKEVEEYYYENKFRYRDFGDGESIDTDASKSLDFDNAPKTDAPGDSVKQGVLKLDLPKPSGKSPQNKGPDKKDTKKPVQATPPVQGDKPSGTKPTKREKPDGVSEKSQPKKPGSQSKQPAGADKPKKSGAKTDKTKDESSLRVSQGDQLALFFPPSKKPGDAAPKKTPNTKPDPTKADNTKTPNAKPDQTKKASKLKPSNPKASTSKKTDPKTSTPKKAEPKAPGSKKTSADSPDPFLAPGAEKAGGLPLLPIRALKPGERNFLFDTKSEPKYIPLDDDLKSTIRDSILLKRKRKKVKEIIDQVAGDVMFRLRDRFMSELRGDSDKDETAGQMAAALKKYANEHPEHGLSYHETELLSAADLDSGDLAPIGAATDMNASGGFGSFALTVAARMAASGEKDVYVPGKAENQSNYNGYAFWKIEDRAKHIPEWDESGVEKQVREAWKKAQSKPLAEKRANELAELVRTQKKGMAEVLNGKTVTGKESGLQITTKLSDPFSWLRQSSATPADPRSQPSLTFGNISVMEENEVDKEFMRIVFDEMNDGEIRVVPNADRTVYYVVQVSERLPATEAGIEAKREELMRADLFGNQFSQMSPYGLMLGQEQFKLQEDWIARLMQKYDVRFNSAP